MSRRWNVVVVSPPPSEARSTRTTRPVVVYAGAEPAPAERAAAALRELGAEVVVVEGDEGALCAAHPTQLRGEACADCGRRICAACRLAANGAARCPGCHAKGRNVARNRRLRQLFSLFLFVVFLHQAWFWVARERALVDATGPVRVALVQFVQPDAAGAPLVAAMNAPGGLDAIGPWLDAERRRYLGPRADTFQVDVLGPWTATVAPPTLPPRDPGWMDLLRVSLSFPRYFHDLARAHGVDPDAYGARVYVVYGGGGDLSADSRGSRKGRLAVSFLPLDSTVAYAQVTVAHELGHILGAADLYDEGTWLARFPEGYVQPWADPPWPQRYAEVMAVDVPLTPSSEREIRSLDEVRVGYRTAADFGWIDAKHAELYYTPALSGPEQALATAEALPGVGTR